MHHQRWTYLYTNHADTTIQFDIWKSPNLKFMALTSLLLRVWHEIAAWRYNKSGFGYGGRIIKLTIPTFFMSETIKGCLLPIKCPKAAQKTRLTGCIPFAFIRTVTNCALLPESANVKVGKVTASWEWSATGSCHSTPVRISTQCRTWFHCGADDQLNSGGKMNVTSTSLYVSSESFATAKSTETFVLFNGMGIRTQPCSLVAIKTDFEVNKKSFVNSNSKSGESSVLNDKVNGGFSDCEFLHVNHVAVMLNANQAASAHLHDLTSFERK